MTGDRWKAQSGYRNIGSPASISLSLRSSYVGPAGHAPPWAMHPMMGASETPATPDTPRAGRLPLPAPSPVPTQPPRATRCSHSRSHPCPRSMATPLPPTNSSGPELTTHPQSTTPLYAARSTVSRGPFASTPRHQCRRSERPRAKLSGAPARGHLWGSWPWRRWDGGKG